MAAVEDADGREVDRGAVYAGWFARQLGEAASLERAAITAMRRLTTRRSAHGRGHGAPGVEGYDALFAGTLAVGEPAAFARLLARGVGRQPAFGFGMLAQAPPGRS